MFEIETAVLDSLQPAIDVPPRQAPSTRSGSVVIICTRGRPNIVTSIVAQLADQTKPPAHVVVIGSAEEDIRNLPDLQNLTTRIGRIGSSLQRNDGLAIAGGKFEYIVFFDDDFVPSRFWLERMESIFASRPDVAGITGRILADGTRDAGIPLDAAKALVEQRDADLNSNLDVEEHFGYGSNVGCNMAFRYSIIRGLEFDERLPLYAWHEDSDFRGCVERRGLFVRGNSLWGVHLGHKNGRVRGVTLGYAQIANAIYLARKGTVPAGFLGKIASKNVLVNAARSFRPERFVDRRGRLRGNLIALSDLVRGRLRPERILEL